MSGFVFDLSGGRPALDFVNTVGGMRPTAPSEHLHAYDDIVAWGRQAKVIGEAASRRLLAEAKRDPKGAARVFASAIGLREALYRIFVAVMSDKRANREDLDLLNDHLARASAQRRLTPDSSGGFVLACADEDLESVVWPVALSAAAILTQAEERSLLKQCQLNESEECSWLFLDETKNHGRRWCSMADCGNKAKARRHYQRIRETRSPGARKPGENGVK